MNTNMMEKQDLTDKQLYMVEQEYEEKKKSPTVMWLLAILVGGGGFHRMYMGDVAYGLSMLGVAVFISWATLGLASLVWVIVELFLIGKRLRIVNAEIERNIIRNMKLMSSDK